MTGPKDGTVLSKMALPFLPTTTTRKEYFDWDNSQRKSYKACSGSVSSPMRFWRFAPLLLDASLVVDAIINIDIDRMDDLGINGNDRRMGAIGGENEKHLTSKIKEMVKRNTVLGDRIIIIHQSK